MIARLIAIAIVIASAIGLVVMAMLDGREIGTGLLLVAVLLFVGYRLVSASMRSRARRHRLVPLSNLVAEICQRIAGWFEERARRWDRCRHCGRSIYYGEGCYDRDRRELGRSLDEFARDEAHNRLGQ